MKVQINELTGTRLDWAVAKCENNDFFSSLPSSKFYYSPSTNWAQGGCIIEREGITVGPSNDFCLKYGKFSASMEDPIVAFGESPLIAAMRCYVLSKLGSKIEILI